MSNDVGVGVLDDPQYKIIDINKINIHTHNYNEIFRWHKVKNYKENNMKGDQWSPENIKIGEKKMKEEDMNFEDAMKVLEQIANELENGELSLEQSVDKFEEGIKISKKCNEILEKAEKKISILIKDGDEIKEENFEN